MAESKASINEEKDRLIREGDKIKKISSRFERGKVLGCSNRRRQDFPNIASFWDK